MTQNRNLALFDLDHTLLPLDSDYQWADFLARTGRAGDPVQARQRNEDLMHRYNAGNLTAEQAAEFMLGLLADKDLNDLLQWQEEFMHEVIRPAIVPQARALVDKHLNAGDLCAIVTATNSFVTAPIAKAFGVEHLIATEPELRNNRYTGKIAGVPSFQAGKVIRVQQWLAPMGLDMTSFAQSWFYSDSTNDLPLLERVSHPVAANPSPALAQIARERHWTILQLFDSVQDIKS